MVRLILLRIMNFGSRGSLGTKALNLTSFKGFDLSIMLCRLSWVKRAISAAFAFFFAFGLSLISNSWAWLHNSSTTSSSSSSLLSKIMLSVGGGFLDLWVDIGADLGGLVGLAEFLEASDCAILSSK